jgi:predicted nucleic acid-binding protein
MRADFKVVLDACVLANYRVANLLLLLAEKPRLYLPVWSDEILAETRRTQVGKLGWEERLADRFQCQLRSQFPESMVTGHEHRVVDCGNDPKDRYVLACAIHSRAELVLTFNGRDWNIDQRIHVFDVNVAIASGVVCEHLNLGQSRPKNVIKVTI